VVLSQFNHANIRMHPGLDKILRLVLVTPNMHRVHHHYIRPETDSNYGNIFSFWDRLFGTYHYRSNEELRYGLDVLKTYNDESLKEQLFIPFDKHIKTDF
jgi:sterol desaturase/sphingolipid hydroxylase (fatty acid hydroxylase superfamily)